MLHVWEKREVHVGFSWGCLRERETLQRHGYIWEDIKMDLQEKDVNSWTRYIWLRIGTSCMFL
jgi:hypothetical protein